MPTDIDELIASLTLEEKCALTAGDDFFSLVAVERLGIPKIRVTDGPSGARGVGLPGGDDAPSNCVPCGTALGATWDPEVVRQVGEIVGRDVRGQGCRGLLAPTVNLHRNPLAGRNFECWSEDPLLTGKLAAAYVRGAQSQGVFATVKHYVGNEAEFERNTIDSVVDERSLRELYLLPFEIIVKEADVQGVMTAYNRLNGDWLNMQRRYLVDILRDEWGFDGLVMTDWFAAADRERSLAAGLDLEMPGPGRELGSTLVEAVREGRVAEADVDTAVRRQLVVFDRLGLLGGPTDPIEPLPESEETNAVLRAAGAAGMVLFTNDGTLPLAPTTLKSVAIIGPRALVPSATGGGSAQLNSHRPAVPAHAITDRLGAGVQVSISQGVSDPSPTVLGLGAMAAPDGFVVARFDNEQCSGEPTKVQTLSELKFMTVSLDQSGVSSWVRIRGSVVPSESGPIELLLAQAGAARVWIDGTLVLDGVEHRPPPGGTEFFGAASKDLAATIDVIAGQPLSVNVEYCTEGQMLAGLRVAARSVDEEALLRAAVEAARAADVAVVHVGTNGDHETEGRDRTDLRLPGRQEELIARVAAANPRTVVVLNAAGMIEMPWADKVSAVLQCWFGGQQLGGAVADVLVGAAEPGGRLPTTVPYRLEHNPAHDNFPGENGQVRYGEGLFIGYRGYEHRAIEPRFPFGHGLGYTTFDIGAPTVAAHTFRAGDRLTVNVPVTNTGERAGSEVVQVYVAPVAPRLVRPAKELKGFAKVHLQPGESAIAEVELDDRSFSYYDPGQPDWEQVKGKAPAMFMGDAPAGRREPGWQLDPGEYRLLVGRSAAEILGECTIEVVAP